MRHAATRRGQGGPGQIFRITTANPAGRTPQAPPVARLNGAMAPASQSIRTQVGGRELSIVNLDKVMYPATGYTKAEVISYYSQIAEVLLPYISDRALTRVRFPDGVAGPSFYEKNAPAGTPGWVRTERILTSDGPVQYVIADEPATVVWLANLAALELHVPQWQVGRLPGTITEEGALERGDPLVDRLVVDLDPGAGMTMIEVARAALIAAERLAADGLGAGAADVGQQGNPGVRGDLADPGPTGVGVRQAAQPAAAPPSAGLLRRHHVGGAAGGPDLRRLQPEPDRAEHDRAVLDAWPRPTERRDAAHLGGGGCGQSSRRPAVLPRGRADPGGRARRSGRRPAPSGAAAVTAE